MLRVNRPYLNLLVKPSFLFRFSGKNEILCILKGKMQDTFQNAWNYILAKKKKMCAYPHTYNVQTCYPKKNSIFYLALLVFVCQQQRLWPYWAYCMRRYLDNYCYFSSTNAFLITGSISFYLQWALQQKFVVGRYEKDKFGFKTLHFIQYLMVLQCLI